MVYSYRAPLEVITVAYDNLVGSSVVVVSRHVVENLRIISFLTLSLYCLVTMLGLLRNFFLRTVLLPLSPLSQQPPVVTVKLWSLCISVNLKMLFGITHLPADLLAGGAGGPLEDAGAGGYWKPDGIGGAGGVWVAGAECLSKKPRAPAGLPLPPGMVGMGGITNTKAVDTTSRGLA